MATRKDIETRARVLGAGDGNDAAGWYFDSGRRDIKREDYIKVIKGIRDGDPEIMDTLPHSPLSGEHSDGMTPTKLWEDLDMNQRQVNLYGEEICTEYEQAYEQSAQDAVEQQAMSGAETELIFHLNVTLVEQDPQKVLNDLEDVLNKHNLDIFDASWEIEGSSH